MELLIGLYLGTTPVTQKDTAVVGTSKTVVLKMDGYRDRVGAIRKEELKVRPLIGGILVFILELAMAGDTRAAHLLVDKIWPSLSAKKIEADVVTRDAEVARAEELVSGLTTEELRGLDAIASPERGGRGAGWLTEAGSGLDRDLD